MSDVARRRGGAARRTSPSCACTGRPTILRHRAGRRAWPPPTRSWPPRDGAGPSCSAPRAGTSAPASTSATPERTSERSTAKPSACSRRRCPWWRRCRVRPSGAAAGWPCRRTSGWPPRRAVQCQFRPPRLSPRLRAQRDAAGRGRPTGRGRLALLRPARRRRRGVASVCATSWPPRASRGPGHRIAGELAAAGPLAVRAIRATLRRGPGRPSAPGHGARARRAARLGHARLRRRGAGRAERRDPLFSGA